MRPEDLKPDEFLTESLKQVSAQASGYVFEVLQRPDNSVEVLSATGGTMSVIGLAPEEVKKDWTLFASVIHPADLAEFMSVLQDGMRNAHPIQWEGRAVLADGKSKWIRSVAVPVSESHRGRIWVGMTTDVTSSKQVELEERRAQGFFKMMLDSGPCVFFVREATPPYNLVYVSDNAKGPFLVKDGRQMVGNIGDLDAIHPDDRETVLGSFERTVKEGKTTIEFRSGDPVRGYRKLVSHKRISESDASYMTGIAYDVSERYLLEDALKRMEADLRTMIESSPTSMAVFGKDGGLNFANRAALSLFELPMELALGHGWLKAIHRADRHRVQDILEKCARAKSPRTMTCRFVLGERETRWCRIELVPSQDRESAFGLIASFMDVTSQRETEFLIESEKRRSQRMHEAQEEANKAMFTELAGPLNEVLSHTTGILEQSAIGSIEDKEDLRKSMLEAVTKIDSFFVLTVENLSMLPLHTAGFDLARTVSLALGTVGAQARTKALEIRTLGVAGQEVRAFADENRVQSVIIAILKACVQTSPIEGILCTDLGQQGDWVTFTATVTSSDAGANVFAPLFRLPSGRDLNGLALELAVAKRLCEAMGGSLNLKTASGHTTVTWELPAEPAIVKQPSDPPSRNLL